jgi:hypothetical protein
MGYAVDVDSIALKLVIVSSGRTRLDSFKLESTGSTPSTRGEGVFSSGMPVVTTVARLAAESREPFRKLQQFVGPGQTENMTLNVSMRLKAAPENATSAKVWIDVLLDPKQGYVTLIDGGTISLNQPQRYGH